MICVIALSAVILTAAIVGTYVILAGVNGEGRFSILGNGSSMNILAIGAESDDITRGAFILMRLDVNEQRILITALSPTIRADVYARDDTLAGHMRYGGHIQAVAAVEYALGIDVDRYAFITRGGFESMIDSLGGVAFNVPEGIHRQVEGALPIVIDEGLQTLTGAMTSTVFSYDDWAGANAYRIQEELVATTINQHVNADNLGRASQLFRTFANTFRTDISLMDKLAYLSFFDELAESRNNARIISLTGSMSGSYFVPHDESLRELREAYSD